MESPAEITLQLSDEQSTLSLENAPVNLQNVWCTISGDFWIPEDPPWIPTPNCNRLQRRMCWIQDLKIYELETYTDSPYFGKL